MRKVLYSGIRITIIIFLITGLFMAASCSSGKGKTDLAPAESVQTGQDKLESNNEEKTGKELPEQTQNQDNTVSDNNTDDKESINNGTASTDSKETGKTATEKTSGASGGNTASNSKGDIKNGDSEEKQQTNNEDSKDNIINDNEKKGDSVNIVIIGPEEVGEILSPTDVTIEDGDTVLNVLIEVTKEKKIQMEYKGAKAFAYIEGIDNIYEFDYGNTSGWKYRVNGTVPGKSCGAYVVKPGDIVEIIYVLDLNDIN